MQRRKRPHFKWLLSIGFILAFMWLGSASSQAYTIYSRAWPAANTTYRRVASYDNQGADWIAAANAADAEWAGFFQFNLDNNSPNLMGTIQLGGGVSPLGVTTFFPAVGPYQIGFTLNINRDQPFYTGAGATPFNRYNLRTVLRHEFGHALGLYHSAGANTLMNGVLPISAQPRFVDQDATNGANFLYNPGAGAPIPEGPAPQSAGSGTVDNLSITIGYKGPS